MNKRYQIVAEHKPSLFQEILETVNNREEAEYAMAHYMIYDSAKYYNIQIVEVGNYVKSFKE